MKYYFSLLEGHTQCHLCVYEWGGMEWVVHMTQKRKERERGFAKLGEGEMDVNVGEREREYVCVNVWGGYDHE